MDNNYTYKFLKEFNKYEKDGKLDSNIKNGNLHPVLKEFRNVLVHTQENVYDNFTDDELANILDDIKLEGSRTFSLKTYNKITELGFGIVVNRLKNSKEYRVHNKYLETTRTGTVYLEQYEFERVDAKLSDKIEPLVIKLRRIYEPNLVESRKIPAVNPLINMTIAYPQGTDFINVTDRWLVISEMNYQTGNVLIQFSKNTDEPLPLRFQINTNLNSSKNQFVFPNSKLELNKKIENIQDVYQNFNSKEIKSIVKFIKSNYKLIYHNYYNLFL